MQNSNTDWRFLFQMRIPDPPSCQRKCPNVGNIQEMAHSQRVFLKILSSQGKFVTS